MTTNLTSHAGAKPAPAKPTDVDHLTQLLKTHRHATAEIYTALRVLLGKQASLFMSPLTRAACSSLRRRSNSTAKPKQRLSSLSLTSEAPCDLRD